MDNIEKQYDKIYRYCYFKLHNRHTAEDITQETFLKYFDKYNDFEDINMLPMLYTGKRKMNVQSGKMMRFTILQKSGRNASI